MILPAVPYYQVVFTLPDKLSRLALGNRREIYNLLFRSAWAALKETIVGEHGYDPAALLVLHTWNQKLDAHAHVHAVVPGGGPALDGNGWRWSHRKDIVESASSDSATLDSALPEARRIAESHGKYLVDAAELRGSYRDHFLRGLQRLFSGDKLKLSGEFATLKEPAQWQQLIEELQSCDWVTHLQPPPTTDCSADNVLKYLARYLSGGPISDSRIESTSEQEVTILAREGVQSGGTRKQVPVTMSKVEFTRRWTLHILPKGYTRTRRFGGWSNPRCPEYLQQSGKPISLGHW